MHAGFFKDFDKKYDFKLIVKKMQQFLIKEGVETADYELDESIDYDGVTVSYVEHFPVMDVPVNYRIHYDSFYGEDCHFSASIGIPRGELVLSDMEYRKIAAECGHISGMLVSFDGHPDNQKYLGIFHVINSVYGNHVMDSDEMHLHLHKVRYMVTDIVNMVFEEYSRLYLAGRCDSHTTIARFKQVNSMADDDRLIIEKDYFEELGYDPYNPVNLKDTMDLTNMLDTAESRNEGI